MNGDGGGDRGSADRGDLLGFLGLIVALRVTAIIQVFARELLDSYRSSAHYSGTANPPG